MSWPLVAYTRMIKIKYSTIQRWVFEYKFFTITLYTVQRRRKTPRTVNIFIIIYICWKPWIKNGQFGVEHSLIKDEQVSKYYDHILYKSQKKGFSLGSYNISISLLRMMLLSFASSRDCSKKKSKVNAVNH